MKLFAPLGAPMIALAIVGCSLNTTPIVSEYTLARPVANVRVMNLELQLPTAATAGYCYGVGYINPGDLDKIEQQEGFKLTPEGQIILADSAHSLFTDDEKETVRNKTRSEQICKTNGLRFVIRVLDSPVRRGYQRVSME